MVILSCQMWRTGEMKTYIREKNLQNFFYVSTNILSTYLFAVQNL